MSVEIRWAGSPRSYTAGRPRSIRYVVLHYTAGAEGRDAAENGAAYDKRRTDGTSTHYFTDSAGAALQEVHDEDQAHAALYHGNAIGVQIEICGTAQTRAQWLDATSRATLQTTAELVAHLCKAHGLPAVRLTVAQCRAAWYAEPAKRPRGIVDHGTVTRAYPEDGGTHTDLGPGFPWDVFMQMVEEEMTVALDADQTRDAVVRHDGAVDNEWPAGYTIDGSDLSTGGETIQLQTQLIRAAAVERKTLAVLEDVAEALEAAQSEVTLSAEQLEDLAASVAAKLQTLVFEARPA